MRLVDLAATGQLTVGLSMTKPCRVSAIVDGQKNQPFYTAARQEERGEVQRIQGTQRLARGHVPGQLAHPDEGPHDRDVHLRSPHAPQDAGEHRHPFLGKRIECPAQPLPGPRVGDHNL